MLFRKAYMWNNFGWNGFGITYYKSWPIWRFSWTVNFKTKICQKRHILSKYTFDAFDQLFVRGNEIFSQSFSKYDGISWQSNLMNLAYIESFLIHAQKLWYEIRVVVFFHCKLVWTSIRLENDADSSIATSFPVLEFFQSQVSCSASAFWWD